MPCQTTYSPPITIPTGLTGAKGAAGTRGRRRQRAGARGRGGVRAGLHRATAGAGAAVAVVLGEEQVDDVPPGLPDPRAVRADRHGRRDRVDAAGLRLPLPLHLHDAEPAQA